MKATGIVRQLDGLGRIVIPMELRRTLGIEEKDPLEIYIDGERIVLQKYAPGCTFCGDAEGLDYLFGKPVCRVCTQRVSEIIVKREDAHA